LAGSGGPPVEASRPAVVEVSRPAVRFKPVSAVSVQRGFCGTGFFVSAGFFTATGNADFVGQMRALPVVRELRHRVQ